MFMQFFKRKIIREMLLKEGGLTTEKFLVGRYGIDTFKVARYLNNLRLSGCIDLDFVRIFRMHGILILRKKLREYQFNPRQIEFYTELIRNFKESN